MSQMIVRVFFFFCIMQTDNFRVAMPSSMTVTKWKLCNYNNYPWPPGNKLSQHNIHARNLDNAQCLDNISMLDIDCMLFSQDGSKCYVFILFMLQSSRFPKQEKRSTIKTMLTRTLAKKKGQRKIHLKLRCDHLSTSFDTLGVAET